MQSELVAIFPLLLLGVCYVAVRLRDVRSIVSLLLILAAPHAVGQVALEPSRLITPAHLPPDSAPLSDAGVQIEQYVRVIRVPFGCQAAEPVDDFA